MNRRKFFAGIAAVVTAACVPASSDYRHILERAGYPFRKGPGHIAEHYGSGLREHLTTAQWWRPRENCFDFAEIEARTLASLQSMWKECRAYKSGDTLIIDEQAYEVFKTLQE